MIKKIVKEVEENGLYPDKIAKKLGIDKKEVVRLLYKHLTDGLERFQELSEEILKEEKCLGLNLGRGIKGIKRY